MSNVRSAATASPMAKPSVLSTAVEHKAFAPVAQQKPVLSSVPPTGASSQSSSEVRAALLSVRKRPYVRRTRGVRFDHRDYTRMRETKYGVRHAKKVNARVADHASVTRTYRTAIAIVENTFEVDNVSFAWSLRFNGVNGFAIKSGGPYSGTNIVTSTLNDELSSDMANLTNTFRYFKLKKITMHVEKMPMWTTTPGTVVWNTTAEQVNAAQVGQQGNLYSAGRFLMRPWAGEPGVCNYATGELVGDAWQDNIRCAKAVTSTANSGYGGTFSQTYTPYSQYLTMDVEGNDAMGNADYQVRYEPTPPVEMSLFRTNNQGLYACGGVFVWYFPSSVNAASGNLATHAWWEFEIEYYGLAVPINPASANVEETKAGSKALLASLGVGELGQLKDLPPRRRPDPEVVLAPPAPAAVSKDKDIEMPDLKKLSLKK